MRGRAAAAVAVAALAVLSSAITFGDSWSWASDQREAFSSVDVRPAVVFSYQQLLPEEAVAFVRDRVRAKERYFLFAGGGGDVVLGVPRQAAARTFARYALLPAVQVADVRDADVVVAVGADPATLGVRFARVEWDPSKSGVAVARIAR